MLALYIEQELIAIMFITAPSHASSANESQSIPTIQDKVSCKIIQVPSYQCCLSMLFSQLVGLSSDYFEATSCIFRPHLGMQFPVVD